MTHKLTVQVCIFVKSVARATQLDALLQECNFPSICIHSGLPQPERQVTRSTRVIRADQ